MGPPDSARWGPTSRATGGPSRYRSRRRAVPVRRRRAADRDSRDSHHFRAAFHDPERPEWEYRTEFSA